MADRTEAKAARLGAANELIRTIASCGRRFFSRPTGGQGPGVAFLERDRRGRIWYHDAYTGRRIYTHHRGRWRGFTHGGGLCALVEALRDFVVFGDPVPPGHFDHWGYAAEDHTAVVAAAYRLGVLADRRQGDKETS